MKNSLFILILLIVLPLSAEEFKCPPDTTLVDFTPSSTQERMQVCQKRVDGTFVKHGPEIIYNKDGTAKSKSYYQMGVVAEVPKKEEKNVLQKESIIQKPLFSTITSISAGHNSIFIVKNGGVRGWGANNTVYKPGPIVHEAELTSGVRAISAAVNGNHTCALINNGDVKCWGWNYEGVVGDGTTITRKTPSKVVGLTSSAIAISTGAFHSCALLDNGSVRCWGVNDNGELGDATNEKKISASSEVAELGSRVHAISAGGKHTCALLSSGGVKCWGQNSFGELGDGTKTNRNTPTQVTGLTSGVRAISAGSRHTCAIMDSGGVKCWGENLYGELGDGTKIIRLTPADVIGLNSGVSAVSAGSFHTCALLNTGGVKCWGQNTFGALGDGTMTDRLIPTQVFDLSSNVESIAAGENTFSCALMNTDEVKCWGTIFGEAGDSNKGRRLVPTLINEL